MDEQKLKEKLTPEQYRVMREKGTETPFTGKFWDAEDEGSYACAACGNELFSSEDKLDSESGWPEFKTPLDEKNIEVKGNEISCSECGSHLGNVVGEGKEKHYRLNSVAMEFEEPEEEEEEEEEDDEKQEASSKGQGNKLKSLMKNTGLLVGGSVIGAGVVGAALFFSQPSFMCEAPVLNTPPVPQSAPEQTAPTPSEFQSIKSPRSPKGVLGEHINSAPPALSTSPVEAPAPETVVVSEPEPPSEPLPQTQTNPYPPTNGAAPDAQIPDPSGMPREESAAVSREKTP